MLRLRVAGGEREREREHDIDVTTYGNIYGCRVICVHVAHSVLRSAVRFGSDRFVSVRIGLVRFNIASFCSALSINASSH